MKSDARNPLCYSCIHRLPIDGHAHSACLSKNSNVTADPLGDEQDWFDWPYNFDPVWLRECDGYQQQEESHERQRQS